MSPPRPLAAELSVVPEFQQRVRCCEYERGSCGGGRRRVLVVARCAPRGRRNLCPRYSVAAGDSIVRDVGRRGGRDDHRLLADMGLCKRRRKASHLFGGSAGCGDRVAGADRFLCRPSGAGALMWSKYLTSTGIIGCGGWLTRHKPVFVVFQICWAQALCVFCGRVVLQSQLVPCAVPPIDTGSISGRWHHSIQYHQKKWTAVNMSVSRAPLPRDECGSQKARIAIPPLCT